MLSKICGMTSADALAAASANGADMCGFIFHPKSPRHIEPAAAGLLPSANMRRVGVFVDQDAPAILRSMREARLDLAQLHGCQDMVCAAAIGTERVIRVLWPARFDSLEKLRQEAESWAPFCALFLLDAGLASGGSGQGLDWSQLGDLRLPRPWLLAGGLAPKNIGDALRQCRPHGLDLNSGVEDAPGVKSPAKIAAALAICRKFAGEAATAPKS